MFNFSHKIRKTVRPQHQISKFDHLPLIFVATFELSGKAAQSVSMQDNHLAAWDESHSRPLAYEDWLLMSKNPTHQALFAHQASGFLQTMKLLLTPTPTKKILSHNLFRQRI